MFQVSMRTFLFVVFAFCVTYLCASLRAEEEIKYPSPNGALALRILDPEDASGKVEIGIMELSTHKVLLDFGGLGHPNEKDAKLVWSADSERVAFFEPTRRGGLTRVFFRNGASFQEVELPTLPNPKLPKKAPPDISDKSITFLVEPMRWLKSGALVIYREDEGDYSGRGAIEVTVGFDKNKASVVKSEKIRPRSVEPKQ